MTTLTRNARAALQRLVATDGRLPAAEPSHRKDPHAWAVWQGFQTAQGFHGERATTLLMQSDDETRRIWDEVSDYAVGAPSRHTQGATP